MIGLRTGLLGGALFAGLLLASGAPAAAAGLSSKACSTKYQDAKKAGTLNGLDWKAFRAAQCSDATATAATPAAAAPAAAATPTTPSPAVPAAGTAAPSPPAAAGAPVFPNAVAQKYASESAGTGRMHTCLDQYHANKATNANGGLHWIQKGGGYYSECTKHLKG
jgi:hypothetical protein